MMTTKQTAAMSKASFSIFMITAVLVLIVFRILYSTPIEFNTESFFKFIIGQQIAETNDWGFLIDDHHSLRWGVVIPQITINLLLPFSYTAYYITPILFFSIFSVLCTRLNPTIPAWNYPNIALLIVISCDPMTHIMASQLNSEGFGLLYATIGFLLARNYTVSTRWQVLSGSAVFLFLAYGAKAYFLLFAAGPLLYFTILRRDYRAVTILLGSLSLLILIESLALYIISNGEILTGRIMRILATHRDQGTNSGLAENFLLPSHFYIRWRLLPKYNVLTLVLFIFCFLLFVSSKPMRASAPPAVVMCLFSASIFLLFVSFPITSIEPLRIAIPLQKRYLAPFFPLASVAIIWIISHTIIHYSKLTRSVVFVLPSVALASLFLYGSTSYKCHDDIGSIGRVWSSGKYDILEELYCRTFRHNQEQNLYPSPDAFALKADKYYRSFNRDYLAGIISLAGGTRIGAFKQIIRSEFPNTTFIRQGANDWYSLKGQPTKLCITELGQTSLPQDNYEACPK